MDAREYARMREAEDRHWWFRGRRAVIEALLANVGESDPPGALPNRLERLGAAQDDAEQRRRQAPEADRRLCGARRPLAREPRDERAGRLAADDHGEHRHHLARPRRGVAAG